VNLICKVPSTETDESHSSIPLSQLTNVLENVNSPVESEPTQSSEDDTSNIPLHTLKAYVNVKPIFISDQLNIEEVLQHLKIISTVPYYPFSSEDSKIFFTLVSTS
jgi:hypothetical protein